MASLVQVYNTGDPNYVNIGRRNLPLGAGNKLMMLMDLNGKGLCIDSPIIRGRELDEFTRKFNFLTDEERRKSLEIDRTEFISVLNQSVQCVGCRRSVEDLFQQLTLSGHPTLDPLELRPSGILSVTEEKLKTPQALGTLLYRHHDVLKNILDNKLRNKTRCVLHSLDTLRAKPFSETWHEVWSVMKNNCRDKLTVIETKELHNVLDNYLKKYKFCTVCRAKIEKAYKILVGELPSKEQDSVTALYANIRTCVADKHIHVNTNKIEFLDALMKRAEPEVNGSYSKMRERQAKTLEIAQEEVLTCVGMIMYERLRHIYMSLREEERACQVLAAVGVHALYRSFNTFMEKKQGISNLELLYQEISRAEKAKELKRDKKKLQKKKKKNEKKILNGACETIVTDILTDDKDEDQDHDKAVDMYGNDEDDDNVVDDGNEPTKLDSAVVIEIETEMADTFVKVKSAKKSKNKQKQVQQLPKNKKKQKSTNGVENTKIKKQESLLQQQQQQHKQQGLSLELRCDITNNLLTSNKKRNEVLKPNTNYPGENDARDSGNGSVLTSNANLRKSSVVSSPEDAKVSRLDGLGNRKLHVEQGGGIVVVDSGNNARDNKSHCDRFLRELNLSQLQKPQAFSLLQIWDDFKNDDTDDKNCKIPQEVVLEYQCKHEKVQQQREQLRAKLREKFDTFCEKRGVFVSSNCHEID